jgi:hypothetical protein
MNTQTKVITRKEYLNNSEKLHHEYYLQFATSEAENVLLRIINKESILNSKDEHLNDIPLKKWDSLAGFIFNGSKCISKPHHIPLGIDGKKLKEAGEGYSCSTGVCVFKAVARELIKNKV